MAIAIEHLTYIYNPDTTMAKLAVDDVTVSIGDGERVGIIGHTGSGKTTLVQHLNGLIKPQKGTVIVNGIDTSGKSIKELRKSVGMVFQYPEHQLFEETVYKDIAFGLKKQTEHSEETIKNKVKAAAHQMDLEDRLLQKSPFELSGGQKRRVAIAGVLVMEPSVLILDEPTAGLDPKGRDELFGLLRTINCQKNTTIIIVSHSMEEVAAFANRVFIMHNGRIAIDTTPEKAFSNVPFLEKMGLSAPQVTYMARALAEVFDDFPSDIHTVEQMVDCIEKVVQKP